MKQVIYTLTCADEPEAQKITNAVLAAKCAACVKRAPVQSSYWWEGKIEEAREVLVIIESTDEAYERLNQVIAQHHSYEEYVLNQVIVSKSNPGVFEWVAEYSHGD